MKAKINSIPELVLFKTGAPQIQLCPYRTVVGNLGIVVFLLYLP
jgi:hypothetical protein